MKGRWLWIAGFFFAGAVHADFQISPVLQITRTAPLFDKPSAKAKLLAEADPGTPVLGRDLSKQKSWILVEDADGNRGWMPTERSNYKDVSELSEQLLPVDPSWKSEMSDLSAEEESLESNEAPSQSSRRGNWELSAAYREGISDGVQTVSPLGIAYLESRAAQGVGVRADFDLGGDRVPYAWRLSFLGRYAWVGSFFRELDVGYERRNLSPTQAGLSVGYSLGMGLSSRLALSLRGGLFLGSERQWNGEFRCRFAF
jgi:hypothetical protein